MRQAIKKAEIKCWGNRKEGKRGKTTTGREERRREKSEGQQLEK